MTDKSLVTLVSVGMSCQTAHQLARFAEQNPDLARHEKSPFDWLVCTPDSATRWLRDGLGDFAADEMVERVQHAYWPRYGFWFWHSFFDIFDGEFRLDLAGNAGRELQKLNYQRQVFCALEPETTRFVLSNTQNNLSTEVFNTREADQYKFSQQNTEALQSALDDFFKANIKLEILSRPDRMSPELVRQDNVHLMPADKSNWKGENGYWDELLRELIL